MKGGVLLWLRFIAVLSFQVFHLLNEAWQVFLNRVPKDAWVDEEVAVRKMVPHIDRLPGVRKRIERAWKVLRRLFQRFTDNFQFLRHCSENDFR